jgi:hypothetical protein
MASVLHPVLSEEDEEGQKLRRVCGMPLFQLPFVAPLTILRRPDFVYTTFKRAGYVTETQPLKLCLPAFFSPPHLTSPTPQLHRTVLITSHCRHSRARGQPFWYSHVLTSRVMEIIVSGDKSAIPGRWWARRVARRSCRKEELE